MYTTIPRKRHAREKGPWWTIKDGKVVVACPRNHVFTLYPDQRVADDGTIIRSLPCGHDRCDFHDFARLAGWANETATVTGPGLT